MAAVTHSGEIAADEGLRLSWCAAFAARRDMEPAGDAYMIRRLDGRVVFAVVDGAGSGPDAASAARGCLTAVRSSRVEALSEAFMDGHRALKGSRGAALGVSLLDLQRKRLRWAAVGDIDGVLLHGSDRKSLVQSCGVLGHRFSGIHERSHPIFSGGVLVMTTDGVSRDYRCDLAGGSAKEIACRTFEKFGIEDDDRLVLAIVIAAQQ